MPYAVIKTKTSHHWRSSTTKNDVVGYSRTRFGAHWMLFWERLLDRYDPAVEWHIEPVTAE